MNPNSIISIISSLEKIGSAEQDKKFKESIMNALQSIVDQINQINTSQMNELSGILTKFELIQYWMIGAIILGFCSLGYVTYRLGKKVRQLESKI